MVPRELFGCFFQLAGFATENGVFKVILLGHPLEPKIGKKELGFQENFYVVHWCVPDFKVQSQVINFNNWCLASWVQDRMFEKHNICVEEASLHVHTYLCDL